MVRKIFLGILFVYILTSTSLGEIYLCKKGNRWFASNMVTCPPKFKLVRTFAENQEEHCFLVGKYTGDCFGLTGACLRACEMGKQETRFTKFLKWR